MTRPPPVSIALRSLSALVLAVAALPVVNLAGSWLSSEVLGLPGGGGPRLAVDLGWVAVAGGVGAWLAVRVAAVAKAAHAWAVGALYAGVAVAAVAGAWHDFPRWFTLGVLALPPLQAWLGWWLAWGRARGG